MSKELRVLFVEDSADDAELLLLELKYLLVVLASAVQHADVQTCYEFVVNGYIVKQVRYERFVKAIGDIVSYWILVNKIP